MAEAAVWTVRRTPPAQPNRAEESGIFELAGDVSSEADRSGLIGQLPKVVDHIVLCVAPSRARGDTHQSAYPAAARGAVSLATTLGARSILYTSSTGVYGRTDGSLVDEGSPVSDADERQDALVEAERVVLDAAARNVMGAVVLRAAGLYGPGRDPARRFQTPPSTKAEGDSWCNFTWQSDAADAVLHLLEPTRFHIGAHLFNCADGAPMRARTIASALGVINSPAAEADATTTSTRRAPSHAGAAGRSNQRIDVTRLLATGWTPSVPTVLHGLRLLGHEVVVEPSP